MKVLKTLFLILVTWISLLTEVAAKIPNPYKVLGVPKDATQQDIKQGFKRRSKKYHPDRNKTDPRAKQKFQKIVNAYQLLKDPQRRRMYDMTGQDNPNGMPGGGFHQGGGFPGGFGINIQDLMRGFGGGFGGQQQQRQRPGGQRASYSFSFGGGGPGGMRFQF